MEKMTQAKWDALSAIDRDKIRDISELHPKLIGLESRTIICMRNGKIRKFRVGRTTGWRPVHLAMSRNAHGSSDVIDVAEIITGIHYA